MSEVTELTVNGIWASSENNGVDLDGLCLMTRPDGIDDWTEEKRRQWLNDNGYDLSVDLGDEGVWLHAVATNLAAIPNAQWNNGDLSWIENNLQPGSLSSPLIFWQLPDGVLPITFAFRTRNGTSGVFQVAAHSMEDKKVTIRIALA